LNPIEALSLGWRSHLIFPRFDGQVTARDDYVLVRTPHNPTYWWGNFLLFDRAPREGDAKAWLAAFDAEIRALQPESQHLAFGIDAPSTFALPADFAAHGVSAFQECTLTLTPEQLRLPRKPLANGFRFGVLRLPALAASAIDLQVESDMGDHEPAAYRVFRERQMQRYGRMEAAGLGHWFGIFAATPQGERLVADCGLFRDRFGRGALGRFQHVETHPGWRRLGLCSALIHAVCRHGFDAMGLASLVIVADPDDVAIVAYEALGFQRGESLWQLERRPAADRAIA
jgi:RimJ/RimL family protein N-acetyltransferase